MAQQARQLAVAERKLAKMQAKLKSLRRAQEEEHEDLGWGGEHEEAMPVNLALGEAIHIMRIRTFSMTTTNAGKADAKETSAISHPYHSLSTPIQLCQGLAANALAIRLQAYLASKVQRLSRPKPVPHHLQSHNCNRRRGLSHHG